MAWSHYYPITYDHTKCGTEDSSDFPVLVYFSAAALKDAAHGGDVQSSAGADILFFSDSALTTQLASEIDYYDAVNGIGWFWVKIATLSHTADGTIYMGVGNSAPPSRTTNPWDTNYKGVWHLPNGASLSGADSTGLNSVTYNSNPPTAAAGQIDGGASFVSSERSAIQTNFTQDLSTFTVSFWIKGNTAPTSGSGGSTVLARGSNFWFVWDHNDSGFQNVVYYFTASPYAYTKAKFAAPTGGVWYYWVAIYGAGHLLAYTDGDLTTDTPNSQAPDSSTDPMYMMGCYGGGVNPAGMKDEVRVSSVARTADWIKAEYNNQFAPGNIGAAGFWTWGAKVTISANIAGPLTNSGPLKSLVQGSLAR